MANPVTASFTHTINGLTVSVTDDSAIPVSPTQAALTISWGDGHSGTIPFHGTLSHTYAAAGTYKIKETVADLNGDRATASASVSVTAPPSGGGGGGGGGGGSGGGGSGGGSGGGGSGGGTGGGTGGGGVAPVASNGQYVVASQSRTIQVLASGQVIDVEQVGFTTIPSNAFSQVLVPLTDWQNGATANYVNPVASAIETLIAGGYAQSASFVQDVDPSTNLLTGYEDFVVSYTPPGSLTAMTTTVRIPITQLAQGASGAPEQALTAAASRLNATAAL